ncbi:Alanine--tRNA ligase [Polystyrenella longa]|uniref:Alanine--tRNA ligase n=1 Tax=Polystyrenella longa TaxID=2528007 RepID=A0A518CL34_9PLAN|nr:alanine--tRNA ligase [Polystyrenella longa]QDU79929.1 Alanine--tRNA ligase [Polystyrenella longa]
MLTNELREKYLEFFESKGCIRRPSDVLIPKDDKTVLFTPAGMNQFKNQFLGIGKLDFTRATTCQKCLRTGDIENVGVTAYHHTFFEMLGNFSFGDYFKREAIHWAWEFLTDKKWLGLNADKLTVTVFQEDDEAFDIWNKEIKLDSSRIRRDNEYENFWPAGAPTEGPDGVCGPCSEIFYHPDKGQKEVEIWNLVFTQFNRVGDPPDNLRPLPKKNIDTGMGLERCAAVLQGVESNFEIDTLRQLCEAAADTVKVKYDFHNPEGRAIRRIADHVRAITMCIHEGAVPGSDKESYVIRQLLRRAVLEGYLLGRETPFLSTLVPKVVEIMKQPYPELTETVQSVSDIIHEEESQFLDTVERGVNRFNQIVQKSDVQSSKTISGDDAFDLHQTYGFLVELTVAMAKKNGVEVDRLAFENRVKEQKNISGSGLFANSVMSAGPLDSIRNEAGATIFKGYDSSTCEAKVVGLIRDEKQIEKVDSPNHADRVGVILDQSPFYGEAGGQVGDVGTFSSDDTQFEVVDTQRHGDLLVHIGKLKAGTIKLGQKVTAVVKGERRAGIQRAHSATHILHHALHQVLGKHATQRGSKVQQDELRFDFAHRSSMTREEIDRVEDIVNQRIAEGASVHTQLLPIEEARKLGAMALFGEKYPDEVRVVKMGEFSTELCGGTHLTSTGQVGLCKVISEEPVGKGVRRITAYTGEKAVEQMRQSDELLRELSQLLKTPQVQDLPQRIQTLQDELKSVKQQLAAQSKQSVSGVLDELLSQAEEVNGVKVITYQPENADRDMLREFADQLRASRTPVAVLLGAEIDGKVALLATVSKELIKQGVKANDCIKVASKVAGGGGGGRPDLAEAGGRFIDKIPEALEAGAAFYKEQLG